MRWKKPRNNQLNCLKILHSISEGNMKSVRIEGVLEIRIPFYFRFPFWVSKDKARENAKRQLKKKYPDGKIRWLRIVK